MRPEIVLAVPITHLPQGKQGQHSQNDCGSGHAPWDPDLFAVGPVCRTPNYHHENSNQWDISVTVGSPLISHLNQSDDRYQSPQIPKPAGHQIAAGEALSP